jgi:hypothetical protein
MAQAMIEITLKAAIVRLQHSTVPGLRSLQSFNLLFVVFPFDSVMLEYSFHLH